MGLILAKGGSPPLLHGCTVTDCACVFVEWPKDTEEQLIKQ